VAAQVQSGGRGEQCDSAHAEKLTEMNGQLSNVLSDLSGVSGMNIIGAILEEEV
jgi:hypothetical protein